MHRNHDRAEIVMVILGWSYWDGYTGVLGDPQQFPQVLCGAAQLPGVLQMPWAIAAGTEGTDNQTEGLGHTQMCPICKEKIKISLSGRGLHISCASIAKEEESWRKTWSLQLLALPIQPSGVDPEVQLHQVRDGPRSRDLCPSLS